MEQYHWTWAAFFLRNAKVVFPLGMICFFLWHGMVVMEWIYEFFGAELKGYGPSQQRWLRFWVIGFVAMYLFGLTIGLFNMWYYRKHSADGGGSSVDGED
ncbi:MULTISPECIES: hypothetical protein [Halomonadaceae]|uniref:hypothetical protein n=1 Tax=Halomonadaceae TaxID=28256 RepID=UPI00159A2BB0|nr:MULTISPECIES: hypothetical protein [Halomonas]QJQ96164.1 hypothetical protein HIO72_13385 [Halomonas sp. PA5]